MAKRKKSRKRRAKKQSTSRNMALFCVSLCMLVGASYLFSVVTSQEDLTFNPADLSRYDLFSKAEEEVVKAEPKKAPRKSAIADTELVFYDLLNSDDQQADNNYSVQIAAFKSYERASKFADNLKQKKRLQCRLVRQDEWILVRWGSFPTKASAERYNKKISTMLDRECMVVKM